MRTSPLKVTIACLFFVGCASTPGVIDLGPNQYEVSRQAATGFTGMSGLMEAAIREGSDFCRARGKSLHILNRMQSDPPYIFGNFPRASIQFRCVDESDSEQSRDSEGARGRQFDEEAAVRKLQLRAGPAWITAGYNRFRDTNLTLWSIHGSRFRRNGDEVSAWIRIDYLKPVDIGNDQIYEHSIQKTDFRCDELTYRPGQMQFYEGDDLVETLPAADWTEAAPGSMIESVAQFVCKHGL
jgi:hypothetical protein